MTTREEEIEAFAIASTASWIERITPIQGLPFPAQIDGHFEDAIASADIAWEARDRYRAARQPAPEAEQSYVLPSTKIAALRMDVQRETMNLDASDWRSSEQPLADAWSAYDAEVIRQHAATLKAQQRGEVRDGA